MKTLRYSLLVVLLIGLGFSTVLLLTRSPRTQSPDANEATETTEQRQDAEPNESVVDQPAPVAPVAVREPVSVAPRKPDKKDASDIASQPASMMRVHAHQVLAKVNDQAIQLKHLVPLRVDEQEQAMTSEHYEWRLNRAIEMELTFQAATARGVDLTSEQKKQVDGVAQRHEATLREYTRQRVMWSSVTLAQMEFEKRLTSALMLQQNLVAAEAHVAPASDPGVQARYEQARSEVLSRLKAKGNINISAVGF
jgi:hypothetical protein